MAKLLLVEDNDLNRDMLSRRLRRRGYEVEIALNGAEAVAIATAHPFDLILMDMSLPIMDGWEATRQLKASPNTCNLPIIALTAHAMVGDRDKALTAGCDDYDTKPIELKRLLDKIQTFLSKTTSTNQADSEPSVEAAAFSSPKVINDSKGIERVTSDDHLISIEKIIALAYPSIIQDRYQIQSILHQDFCSPVIVALDRLTGATVLLHSIQTETESLSQKIRIALQEEKKKLHYLGLPFLKKVYDHQIDQAFYIIHELDRGYTLDHLLSNILAKSNKPWPLDSVLKLMDNLLQQLFPFHHNNQFHGGLRAECFCQKPGLTLALNQVTLIDSGLGQRVIMQLAEQVPNFRRQLIQQRGYSPPEQRIGNTNLRSDLYSLGLLGLQALTGIPPKNLITMNGQLTWQQYLSQLPASNTLVDWFEKMVSLNHIERYEHAMEAYEALLPHLNLTLSN